MLKMELTTTALLVLTGSAILFARSTFAAESTNQIAEPFKVTVTSATNRVHLKEPFQLHLKVENVSTINQYIDTWTCAWLDNWRSDNSMVRDNFPGCNNNIPGRIELASGKSWENDWDQFTVESTLTNKIFFRMGFTPSVDIPFYVEKGKEMSPTNGDKNIYWSNKVTIEVIPN